MKSTEKIFSSSLCIPYETLVAYHEEKLGAKEQHAIEQHLIDCNLCSEALEGIALLQQPVHSGMLKKRFENEVLKNENPVSRLGIHPGWYAAAAAIAVTFLSVIVYQSLQTNPERTLAVQEKKTESPEIISPQPITESDQSVPKENLADGKREAGNNINSVQPPSLQLAGLKVEEKAREDLNTQEMALEKQQTDELKSVSALDADAQITEGDNAAPQQQESEERLAEAPVAFSSAGIARNNITYIAGYKVIMPEQVAYRQSVSNPAAAEKERKKKNGNVEARYENAVARDSQITIGTEKTKVPSYAQVIEAALLKLKAGEFDKAEKDFKRMLQSNATDLNALFYQGICFYETSDTGAAVAAFTKVKGAKDITFREEAEWYLALTRIKSGNKEEAKKLLSKIVSEKGFYSEKARVQLENFE